MFRQYPRHATRVLIHQFITDLFGEIRRGYYPDTPYLEAIEFTVIANAIVLASNAGGRLTVKDLAERIGMPRRTLSDKLRILEAKGYIRRDGRDVVIVETLLATAEAEAVINRVIELIYAMAEALHQVGEDT